MAVTSHDAEPQPASTKSLFRLTIFLIALDVFFLSFSVLDAIAFAQLYNVVALFSIVGLALLAGLLLLISINEGFWLTFFPNLMALGIGVGIFFVGAFILFVTVWSIRFVFVALLVYGGIVLLLRSYNLRHALILLSITILFSISWIGEAVIFIREYDVLKSTYIGDKSYHLVLNNDDITYGYLTIRLYECSSIGTACQWIYQSHRDHFPDDQVRWEVTEGEETIITISAYDEVIHREVISSE